MHYIIDGYNLLFRMFNSEADLKTQRLQFIEDINHKACTACLNISIVFDAAFQVGQSTRSHFNHIEILFTSIGESADDFILNMLQLNPLPKRETVVTSDNRLAWHARRLGAKTQSVEAFSMWLAKAYQKNLHRKKEKKAVEKPSILQKTPPKQPLPDTQNHPDDGGMEYYLSVFEKQYALLKQDEIEKKTILKTREKAAKKKKNLYPKGDIIGSPEAELERWLKIFSEEK